MQDDLYQFIVCDYYATGEGRTVSLLITRAYPRADDYEDMKPNLKPGHTAKVRAAREFGERFGGWFLQGAENLPRDEFLKRYKQHISEYAVRILNAVGEDRPGNFNFSTQIHLNFS